MKNLKNCFSAIAIVAMMFTVTLLAAGEASAQKIYLLVSVDTADYEPGKAIAKGSRSNEGLISSIFADNVPEHQLVRYGQEFYIGPELKHVTIDTPWLGPDVLDNSADMGERWVEAIRTCPAGPDDTIVFAISVHGGTLNGEHQLSIPGDKGLVPRKELSQALRNKGCRLAVLMTESCASIISGGERVHALAEPKEAQLTEITPAFHSLFIKARGLVDFNSSTESQYGMFSDAGGFMTMALAAYSDPTKDPRESTLEERGYGVLCNPEDGNLSWKKVKSLLEVKVDEIFQARCPDGVEHKGEGWTQTTQTPHFFSLPDERGGHKCFLVKLFQKIRSKKAQKVEARRHCVKTRKLRARRHCCCCCCC